MGEIELAFHVSAWPEPEFVMSLAGIAEAGFRAMEVRANVVPQYEDRVPVFQEMLAQQGVTLAAIETWLRPLTPEILEEEVERCANVARFLRANRAEILVLYAPARRADRAGRPGDSANDWKLATDAINQVGRRTLDLDVRTCVTPAAGTIAQSRRETERLLENTDPEFVHMCLDASYLAWAGISPSHFARKHGARIDYVHLQDIHKPRARKRAPQPPQPAVFGKGHVKMKSVSRLIDALDYNGWITLLCPGEHDNPVAVAGAARSLARGVFGLA
jgi:sugar phosphate isomerase/epimerase